MPPEPETTSDVARFHVSQKTWEETLEHVRYWRRRGRSVLLKSNWGNFRLWGEGEGEGRRVRMYCLGMTEEEKEHSLLFVDVPSHNHPGSLQLHSLFSNNKTKMWGSRELSKEEELRRERMRCTISGITTYHISAQGKFLFSAGASLISAQDNLLKEEEGFVMEELSVPVPVMDAQPSPSLHSLIAFLSDGDIYLQHGVTCLRATSYKLTPETPCYAGSPCFVIQEEFDRYSSVWWSPVSHAAGRQHLLFEVTDEREVMQLGISVPASLRAEVDNMRYPRAGTENASSTLKLLDISLDSHSQNPIKVTELCLSEDLKTLFPWFEYIVRADWFPDGTAIWVQLMSRRQNRLALVHIPVEFFVGIGGSMQDLSTVNNARVTVLLDETNDIWINFHDLLYLFPVEKKGEVRFLWCSEKTGFDHIYYEVARLGRQGEPLGPFPISETAITHGDWAVKRKSQITVDEARGLVYFVALKDTVLESHVYVTSYKTSGCVKRLTALGKSHCNHRGETSLVVDTESGVFVSWMSSLTEQPTCWLYRLDYSEEIPWAACLWNITTKGSRPETPLTMGMETEDSQGMLDDERDETPDDIPELISYRNEKSGFLHHSVLIRPINFRPGVKYPVLVYCYGGPEVQLVKNIWFSWMGFQKYTALGYAVVITDGRGSSCRGLQFESAIKEKMGTVEVEDQVQGLLAVRKACGDVLDFERIAIFGWSYGGYLSLHSVVQRPDIFKVAIAGGPVTSWHLYDTGYTERYMGLPQEKGGAYGRGSVLGLAKDFPNEPGRLLILHGLIDENVHFKHTAKLIEHLTGQGKPYDLRIFPRERHGVRSPEANEHMDATILNYLERNL